MYKNIYTKILRTIYANQYKFIQVHKSFENNILSQTYHNKFI